MRTPSPFDRTPHNGATLLPDYAEMAQRHLSKARHLNRRGMTAEAASFFRIAKAMADEAQRVREASR